MRKILHLLLITCFLYTGILYSQTFDWETATDNGPTVTQTVSGITATVTTSNNEAHLVNGGGFEGSSGNVAFTENGNSNTFLKISFSSPVNVLSIFTFLADAATGPDPNIVFTPTGGSNATVTEPIAENAGEVVNLNWIGITEITLTKSDGGLETFGIDDIVLGTPCLAPTAQATSAVFGSETSSTVNLTSFTAPTGGADGYAVYINDSNSFTAPTNGDEPTADVTWNGAGQQPVYFGTSASPNITVSDLAPGTTYHFQVYAYNDCSGTETYETTGLNSNDTTALGVLTVTGLTGDNKVYDGTVAASASGTASLSGVASGANSVSLSGSPVFTYASANVGNGITISTTGYSLSGTDAGKYTLTQPTLSGNITATELTITGLTGDNKVYDGTTAATAGGTATLSGVIGADDVSLGGSPVFTFASANVGTGVTINTSGYTISGTSSGNYTLTQPTLSGNITAIELTITGLTGNNKVYDSTTTATASGTAVLSGVLGTDDVSLGGSPVFTFASANVGTGITINTSGYAVLGTDSGNYTLTQPTLSGNITSPSVTWTGATNNDWGTASNWNGNFVPPSSANVTIPSGLTRYPTISSATTVNSINIASSASLIANANVTGEVTYTRNLPTTNWYLVAAPVSGETQQDVIANHIFATGTGSNIGIGAYTNNGAISWTYASLSTTGPIISGAGVSMKLAAPGDVSITGTLNVFNVSFPISIGTRDNFNLLGNPYTSYVNSSTFASANTALLSEETVWLWNGSQYVTYNNVNPIEVAPAQGFFVEASGSGNVIFSTANQSHQTSNTFMRQTPKTTFELFLTQGKAKRSTKVFYVDGKTTGFDNGYDSKMFGGVKQDIAVFTQLVTNDEGKKLAIQTLPNSNYESMVIPVGLIAKAGQKLTISAEAMNLPSGIEVYLEDRTNGVFTNLSLEDYKFTLSKNTTGVGRFYLHTSSQVLSTDTIAKDLENVSVYASSKSEITITGLQTEKAKVSVYSLLGKKIVTLNISSNGKSVMQLPNLATGVYLVNVSSELGKISKKIVIE